MLKDKEHLVSSHTPVPAWNRHRVDRETTEENLGFLFGVHNFVKEADVC